MKHRNELVGNSLSSSFLVAFDYVPESISDLRNTMFPINTKYVKVEDRVLSEDMICLRVLCDISKSKPITQKEVLKDRSFMECYSDSFYESEFSQEKCIVCTQNFKRKTKGVFSYVFLLKKLLSIMITMKIFPIYLRGVFCRMLKKYPSFYDGEGLLSLDDFNYIDERVYGYKVAAIEDFFEDNAGKVFYMFEYSDNGAEVFFEKGNIFRNISHIEVCKH